MDIPIIFEDNDIVVINKPAGLLVHPTHEEQTDGDVTLVSWLKTAYPEINNLSWPDASRPGIIHRLDRDTSGVMVVAKNPESLVHLQKQFADRQVGKTYLALVAGTPSWEAYTLKASVSRSDGTRRKAHFLQLPGDHSKEAETDFVTLERFSEVSLVEASPRTGRTHQIRIHLGLLELPILGDPWYETKRSRTLTSRLKIPRLMLHAQKLTLSHPRTGERVSFEAPLPSDFAAALAQLRQ